MIERLIEYSVRNPLVVVMIAAGVMVWGVYATLNTPVDAIPDLSENQVIVFADWPGRSPREVEDQLTYPLSVNLQGLAGVKAIRATSEFGFSMLNIIFDEDIDFYFARQRILERLSIASSFLPSDVEPYLAPDATALGQIFWYTVEGDGYDLGRLRAIQDWFVRYQLYSVPGVAEVASVGGFPIEYQVDIDPSKLRSYGVTLGEVYSAVARSNSSVGGRVVQKGNSEYLVRSTGWIESLDDVEQTVVRSVDGTPVRVGDIATVQYGSAQRRSVLEKNGQEAVGGVVLMRHGENPLEVTERVKNKIRQLQGGLPAGVRIVPFYDRTRLVNDAVETVSESLLEEMLVASLVIFVVMRHARSAALICLTLPLAVLISFILMRQLGISSNIMSLSGIAISVGVLVDAAIVMVDQAAHTLHTRFGNNKVRGDTRELLLPALRTVGRPIFFSLAIMILSFVPVFALSGMEGRMFHPLAYTKSFALIGVSVLAITLLPAVIPWVIRGRVRHETDSWLVRRVIEIYRPVLSFLMDHPWPVVWIVSAVCILGAIPTGSAVIFGASLVISLGLAAWAAWGEEASFRQQRGWVVALWTVAVASPLLMAITQGWRPYWLPATLRDEPWLLAAAVFASAAAMAAIVVSVLAVFRYAATVTILASLVLLGLTARQSMTPLGREFMPPLDEGSILDMPVTIPRASVTQVAADLKARDAVIRSFPEVESVVGKAGRAETPTDPAPLDMVETVINLRPREQWPKRELRYEDAAATADAIVSDLVAAKALPGDLTAAESQLLASDTTMFTLEQFDAAMRLIVRQEQAAFDTKLSQQLKTVATKRIMELLRENGLLLDDSTESVNSVESALPDELGERLTVSSDAVTIDELITAVMAQLRERGLIADAQAELTLPGGQMQQTLWQLMEAVGMARPTFFGAVREAIDEQREDAIGGFVQRLNWRLADSAAAMFPRLVVDAIRSAAQKQELWDGASDERLTEVHRAASSRFAVQILLWRRDKGTLLNELDSVVRMPGWGNIWTQPIINRIDMLATGVNTTLGVRVFGDSIERIAEKSEEIAAVLKKIRGAVDVSADQVVGEGYLEIDIDRQRASRYGINVADIQETIETALGGRVITTTVEGRERFPVRIRYARAFRQDERSVEDLLVAGPPSSEGQPTQVPLSQVADVRISQGPSMIRSENGLLRSYVRLNVRDRDVVGFVEEARQAVASQVDMPAGMYVEWTGQFEHELRARQTLSIIVPAVVLTIFVLLFIVYHDLADTLIVMGLTVPGAVFGGVLFQYLFGYNFSVAVWVGFIACFGLATEGGLVILVYLREAIEQRGGLESMTLPQVREAVMDGAVHRLRPKLMTELTTMIGLAPMLWASGTGSEIMQPMAAPVLGGILVADEVVDLLLPVLFYRIRVSRWRKIHRLKRSDEPEKESVADFSGFREETASAKHQTV